MLDEIVEEPNVEPQPPVEAEAPPAEPSGDPVGEQEPQEYVPNYSYKIRNEEKEFDEWVRGAVTSKEQEEALRELYTKANGLGIVKESYSELEEEVNTRWKPLEEQHNQLTQGLQNLGNLIKAPQYENRDYRSFFETFKIPNEHILQYAKNILDYQEMTPEQRQAHDHQIQLQQSQLTLQQQNEFYQQQLQEQAIQARDLQITTELNRADVSSFAQEFDRLARNPGAFRQQVLNEGAMYFNQFGKEASPQELVSMVMQKYQGFVPVSQAPAPQGGPAAPAPQGQAPVAQQQVPVIPNPQGTGNSPARQKVTSLDDIRAIRQARKSS